METGRTHKGQLFDKIFLQAPLLHERSLLDARSQNTRRISGEPSELPEGYEEKALRRPPEGRVQR